MYSLVMAVDKTHPTWTFLSNHGHILVHINRNPDSKVKEIAEAVGITERSALSILSDLESSGYITIERIGRRNSYRVNSNKNFRHPMEAQQPISALLRIFSKK
ncbi:MAG: winged helix-turn-helix transcriptional regulator [Candidatus Planktophila sp.]|jgi:predicted transcriptional regulator|nr:winged helix-turn-helix transcriptional regulator [Candidatus Planktophila sp.]